MGFTTTGTSGPGALFVLDENEGSWQELGEIKHSEIKAPYKTEIGGSKDMRKKCMEDPLAFYALMFNHQLPGEEADFEIVDE